MKWFQQNRALGTLPLVSGVCILLGAVLLYSRWGVWSEAKQTFDQATAERNRLQGLNPFPNEANYRKLQGYLESYSAALDKFKDELKTEVAPAPPLAPNEFQSRLRQATLAAEEQARKNNVKLPDKFELGFDEFARIMPSTAVAALLRTGTLASSDVHQHFTRCEGGQHHVISPSSVAGRTRIIANTGAVSRPTSCDGRQTGRHAHAEINRAQRG